MKKMDEQWRESLTENPSPKKGQGALPLDDETKDPSEKPISNRRKKATDTGSRWVAPVLLLITIVLSLLFRLLKR